MLSRLSAQGSPRRSEEIAVLVKFPIPPSHKITQVKKQQHKITLYPDISLFPQHSIFSPLPTFSPRFLLPFPDQFSLLPILFISPPKWRMLPVPFLAINDFNMTSLPFLKIVYVLANFRVLLSDTLQLILFISCLREIRILSIILTI